MKTLHEFYEELKTSDELKKEFAKAAKAGKVTEFLKAHDCRATAEELKEFIHGRIAKDTPLQLSDDELDLVAGGTTASVTCFSCAETGCVRSRPNNCCGK